jgi:hypothetical protein
MILELGDKMSYIIIRHAALSRVKCIFMIFLDGGVRDKFPRTKGSNS